MMRVFLLVGVLATFTGGSGCGNEPAPAAASRVAPQDSTEQRTVLAVLDSLQQDSLRLRPLREAFRRLDTYAYTRFARTVQYDAHHRSVGMEQRVTRHAPGAAPVVEHAEGTFEDTAGHDDEPPAWAALPDVVLPDDPSYLAPRNRSSYRYRVLPDTVLWGLPARVLDVRALPSDTDQPLRRARFYLDPSSGALIAYALERSERALFFREKSRYYLSIRPGPDGSWVPSHIRFDVELHLPLRPTESLHRVVAYYAYRHPDA